jgi:predicted TIM-barrel fold metal-dependent hydrolase
MWYDMEPLPMKPSEYFLRQGFVACDPDEFHLKGVVDALGDDNLVWNTDYSHPDAPDPDKALPDFLGQPISEVSKQKILWDNAVRLYGTRILN